MASQLKKLIVKELTSRYQDVDTCVVISYQGVNAKDTTQVKHSLREKNITFNVIKNSTAQMALKEVGLEDVGKLVDGPTAIVVGGEDPVSLAKGLKEWSKKIPAIKIKGGFMDGRLLTQQEVEVLASLPSREILNTQILLGIRAPMVKTVSAFAAPLRGLITVLQAIRDQKQEQGS